MRLLPWVRAARLPAQSNIAPSLIMGQALALAMMATFSWSVFGWLLLFGLLDHLYIVFANDVADAETDRANQTATPFSGGSRVLPEGQLSSRALSRAANACAILLLGVSAVLALAYARPIAPLFASLALALLWAYSYPPCRLSYRGGGELLQMLGIGVVLPTLGYYAQAGTLAQFPWSLLLAVLPMQLAGAVATALPDAPSDGESGKRTLAVRLGQRRAQRFALVLQLSACLAYLAVAREGPTAPATWAVIAAPLLAVALQASSRTAVPGQRSMLVRVFLILGANAALTCGLALVAVVHP